MSYNPNRHAGGIQRKTRSFPPPQQARVKNDSAVKIAQADLQNGENTSYGKKLVLFKNKNFESELHLIGPRNNTGKVKHLKKDRYIHVVSGLIYVSLGEEFTPVTAGQGMCLRAGTFYTLATSGDASALVMFSQDANYEKGLEQVTEVEAVTPVLVPKLEAQQVNKGDQELARKQAALTQEKKMKREGGRKQAPVAHRDDGVVMGVNPQPIVDFGD
jgi:mannose-6-phosphate isomerase-like protein (cupin superfamily)